MSSSTDRARWRNPAMARNDSARTRLNAPMPIWALLRRSSSRPTGEWIANRRPNKARNSPLPHRFGRDLGTDGQVIEGVRLGEGDGPSQGAGTENHVGVGEQNPSSLSRFGACLKGMRLAQPAGGKVADVDDAEECPPREQWHPESRRCRPPIGHRRRSLPGRDNPGRASTGSPGRPSRPHPGPRRSRPRSAIRWPECPRSGRRGRSSSAGAGPCTPAN